VARPKDGSAGGHRHVPRGFRSIGAEHAGAGKTVHLGRPQKGRPSRGPTESSDHFTDPTGQPGGTPKGPSTPIDPGASAENRRSLSRENEVAALLADSGYAVRQNPTESEAAKARQDSGDQGTPRSKPDYLIEDRVFDCYSPNPDTGVRNVWSYVKDKIKREQTERVIVDLKDWRGDISEIRRQFHDWPINNLKEVKLVDHSGKVVQLLPDSNPLRRLRNGD
jgi:hypothetical protein